jgi:integrase
MSWLQVSEGDYDRLLQKDSRLVASDIIDYIIYLRNDKKLAPATISTQIAAIKHFYELNDVELKWNKIKSFKAEYHSVVEDRPYTREEIKLLVDRASLRDKAVLLLMASAGLRVGAVPSLTIKDLLPIDKHNLYQITVYKKSKAKYITFCTPECRKTIDEYIGWRKSLGEEIKPESPLFRKSFDRHDLLQVQNNPQPLSLSSISWILNQLLYSTGVRTKAPGASKSKSKRERKDTMQAHGLRKYFDTTCTLNGMDGLYVEKLMGHGIGIKAHYFKPTPQELLEGNDHKLGYTSVIDALTINEENRLRRQVEQLTIDKNEIYQFKKELDDLKDMLNLK